MSEKEKIKGFLVPKRLSQQAKLAGLNYNTFFIFIVFFSLSMTISSAVAKYMGMLFAIILSGIVYGVLYFLQSKLDSRKLGKIKNDFYNPVPYLKVKTSFSRLHKKVK